jgi:calnexin
MTPIVALGLELWSMTDDIVFDNFFIGSSKKDADEFAGKTWYIKSTEERKADPRAQSVIDAIQEVTQDKPWVWAVVALVVGLPVALIVMYCCTGKSSPQPGRIPSARQKKTDEPTPDEVTTSTASTTITEEERTNGAAGSHDEVKERSGKAALESESESENEEQLPATGGGDKSTTSEEEEVSSEKVVTKRRLRKE